MTMGVVLAFRNGRFERSVRNWEWRLAAGVAAVAFLTLWATYFFQFSVVTLTGDSVVARFPGHASAETRALSTAVTGTFWVPAGEFFYGVLKQTVHTASGHPATLFDAVSTTGWWWYFPVVIMLKWPTVILLLCAAGVILGLARRRPPIASIAWIGAAFPVLYFCVAMLARVNIGDRHILPIYPFLLLGCAAAWQLGRTRPRIRMILLVLLVLHVGDGLRYAPDYLTHFNVFVRTSERYRLLSDSNLDWGQGLKAVRAYEALHPDQDLSLAYFGSVDPRLYGVRARALAEDDRVQGVVMVGATHLSGQYLSNRHAYAWVLECPRLEILANAIYVHDCTHTDVSEPAEGIAVR